MLRAWRVARGSAHMATWLTSRHLAAAIAGGAAAVFLQILLRRAQNEDVHSFTVLHWNVLAAPFTFFNRAPPKCVCGHRNPSSDVESAFQTAARYQLASEALLEQRTDVVLLQELDVAFLFDAAANPKAAALAEVFELAGSTNQPTVGSDGPGTAVLIRKGGALRSTGIVKSVGASKATGGTSKSATCVLAEEARPSGGMRRLVWLVSIHLSPPKHNEAGARALLELLADALRSDHELESTAGPSAFHLPAGTAVNGPASERALVVVGGDFNAEPHELHALQRGSLLGALRRVAGMGHTGLSATFATPETIDHLLVSPGLRPLDGRIERVPSSPYSAGGDSAHAAAVVGASDHVWQSVRLAWG